MTMKIGTLEKGSVMLMEKNVNPAANEYAYYANPFFNEDELRCHETGEYYFSRVFLAQLIDLRRECNFPFRVSSAYRSPRHPIEAAKIAAGRQPGAHSFGRSCDILVSGKRAYKLVKIATSMKFRVGISQRGKRNKRFIHIDTMSAADEKRFGSPIWSY